MLTRARVIAPDQAPFHATEPSLIDLQKLAELKRLLVSATDFSDVFGFFMDHFGEKPELMTLGGQHRDPVFVQMLEQLGSRVIGKKSQISSLSSCAGRSRSSSTARS